MSPGPTFGVEPLLIGAGRFPSRAEHLLIGPLARAVAERVDLAGNERRAARMNHELGDAAALARSEVISQLPAVAEIDSGPQAP